MMTWERLFVGLVALTMCVPVHAAWATDSPDDLAAEGIRLRRAGRDPEALPLFRRLLELKQTPKAHAQLGLCEQAVGLWVDAEEHLEQALRAVDDAWIAKNLAVLREALGVVQGRLGSIEVWGEPKGASVTVDDRTAGRLPMERPARATAGQHAIRVEAAGFLTVTRTVEVMARKLSREQVVLVPVAVATADVAAARPPAETAEPVLTVRPPVEQKASPTTVDTGGDRFYTRWWFWTIVGAVVVAGGISAYLLTRGADCSASPTGGTCEGWN
jgi:hypothetical protein